MELKWLNGPLINQEASEKTTVRCENVSEETLGNMKINTGATTYM